MSPTTINFSYVSVHGKRTKKLHTTDTPLLALMKFFGKFGTVYTAKIVDGSTVVIEFPEGFLEVFNVSIEGKRGPKPLVQ